MALSRIFKEGRGTRLFCVLLTSCHMWQQGTTNFLNVCLKCHSPVNVLNVILECSTPGDPLNVLLGVKETVTFQKSAWGATD